MNAVTCPVQRSSSAQARERDIGHFDGQKKRLEIPPRCQPDQGKRRRKVARTLLLRILTAVPLSIIINGRFYGTTMASRRDSSSKRLLELFDETRQSRELAKRFFEDDILKPASTTFDQLFAFNNDAIHAAFSRVALRLNNADKKDASLLAAFRKAGLDHKNPLHWRDLLSMFAETHFGKVKTKPREWDAVGLTGVLNDYLTIKGENPDLKEPELRKKLRSDRRFKDKYAHYNIDAFRKLLRQAKSPDFNVLLRHPQMRDPLGQIIRDDHEQKGTAWTPEWEALIKGLVERFFNALESEGQSLKPATRGPDSN